MALALSNLSPSLTIYANGGEWRDLFLTYPCLSQLTTAVGTYVRLSLTYLPVSRD